jgi:hypothetical protein
MPTIVDTRPNATIADNLKGLGQSMFGGNPDMQGWYRQDAAEKKRLNETAQQAHDAFLRGDLAGLTAARLRAGGDVFDPTPYGRLFPQFNIPATAGQSGPMAAEPTPRQPSVRPTGYPDIGGP